MKRESIDEVFREHFPRTYMEKFFRGLFAAHKLAREESKRFESPEARNYEPGLRRALIQTVAHEVAATVEGMKATPTQGDETKSSWFHRRVEHDRAILTIHSAGYPDEVLPPSDYRKQYADTSVRQRLMFEDDETHDLLSAEDWIVYGMLLHGRGMEPRGRLGFAVIRFPIKGAVGYHTAHIDLFKEFPAIVAEMQPNRDAQAGDDEPDIGFHEGEDLG